ncbi:MAG: 2Fe-2S iron-sulfur cluster-binding protein [Gemmatimonadaceae bacterium]
MSTTNGGPTGASFDFEGRTISAGADDTIASALFRAGVRTFSRSFKYHRRRGLYCLTGDCPNCLMTVDGEPAVRTCVTPASGVQKVARGAGWPSADTDALSILWRLRALMPVGFYYKSMIRPRWIFPIAERVIRRIAGLGPVPRQPSDSVKERKNHHPDVVVIGGGIAGLAAALAAAEKGERVVLVDEGAIGECIAPGSLHDRVVALRDVLLRHACVTILERATAVGIFEGPLVPVVGEDFLHLVHPSRIVVATGAVERHAVFSGNDLPGVWLGRGASRMAGAHGLTIGSAIVVATNTLEGLSHLDVLHRHASAQHGGAVVAALVPAALANRVPAGVDVIGDGKIVEAIGSGALRSVVVEAAGRRRVVPCDTLVISLGLEPRDGLLRQSLLDPVRGAGDVVHPGCSPEEAEESGRQTADSAVSSDWGAANGSATASPDASKGFVCLCEDVSVEEFEHAWDEGYRSTELLKRYSTVTMGACQGTLCHPHLKAFVCHRSPETWAGKPTTSRPPARTIRLEDLAAGARVPLEHHTSLHDRHVAHHALMDWAGSWKRPSTYGNVEQEYWAVRRHVSVMDVSTLGKYRIAGPDATAFLEYIYPCHVGDLKPWRSRYTLLLNEAGYLFDDGLVCKLGDGSYYVTFTSSGGDGAESWLREWADDRGLRVHIANMTASRSAINVTGPRARELLRRLTSHPLDAESIPYGGLAEMVVDNVPCLALRVGFVGELSYELHHASRQSEALWDALLDAGREFDIRPHGLDALKLLRLEKGHILIGQDTDFDTTPSKVGLDFAVKMNKPDFVGRTALQRLDALPRERSLLGMTFAGSRAPEEGAQLFAGGVHVGYLTSSRFSPSLGCGVALGWVRHPVDAPPPRIIARDTLGDSDGVVTKGPFYDPKGERLRA